MRNGPAAAGRVSRSRRVFMACVFCSAPFSDVTHTHVCVKCGAPQPVDRRQDHFSLFGVKRGFRQDLPALEKTFYTISRTLHPDRFVGGSDAKWKLISVERMSAINRAYQTLTGPDRLREYLLGLEGVISDDAKVNIPADLAEEWFELQDTVLENPERAEDNLSRFETDLRLRRGELEKKISDFEKKYDAGVEPRETLMKIDKLVRDGQYLKSLERDLLKLKGRLGI